MVSKQSDEPEVQGLDGETLDSDIAAEEQLPHGLVRLPSGMIAVTRLYCPNGHNVVDSSSPARFNRLPGIVLMVEGQQTKGNVILSPIHGDDTRFGEAGFQPGEVTRVSCPSCGEEFPRIQPCGCQENSELIGFFLDEKLEDGNQVVMCNAWGCLRSRIMDRFQLISKC